MPRRESFHSLLGDISDLIEGKEQADSEGWQPRAARHAAAFAFEVLSRFRPPQESATQELTLDFDRGRSGAPPARNQAITVRGVAPTRTRSFIGRSTELEQIHAILMNREVAQPTLIAIHGLSGVGKTQLCREYMQLHQDEYDLTYWISAPTQAQGYS